MYPHGLRKIHTLKVILRELWLDLTFKTQYTNILFNLIIVSISGKELNSQDILAKISQLGFEKLNFTRSAICDIRTQDISFTSYSLKRMQNDGIESNPRALRQISKNTIWIWRVQKKLGLVKPVQIETYLTNHAQKRKVAESYCDENMIKITEVLDGFVSRGLYAEKFGEILPTSKYYLSELPRELPSFYPFFSRSDELMVVNPKDSIELNTAVFAGFNSNYYHFTWEILPRLLNFYDDARSKEVPVILNKNLPAPIRQMVKEVSGVEPILMGDDEYARIKRLYIPYEARFNTQVDFTDKSQPNIFNNRAGDLIKIRTFFEARYQKNPLKSGTRLFVSRPKYDLRVPSNLPRLHELLESKQFLKIHPESMTFAEQVCAFRDAEQICILAGASVTNLMYCQNIKKLIVVIVDLKSPSTFNFWQDYCAFLGIKTTFVYADDVKKGFGPIDISVLNAALS
jgi:hypothetical protein